MKSLSSIKIMLALMATGGCLLLLTGWVASEVNTAPTTAAPIKADELPPGKATFIREIELTHIAVLTSVPSATVPAHPMPPSPVYPAATPEPGRPAGAGWIVDHAQGPFSVMNFRLKNLWYERLPDRHLTIYAGGEGSTGDPAQGGLTVVNKTLDELDIMAPSEYYRTPTKAGPVTITDAVGERLTLQATDGTRFYFDVATRQWVNP